MPAIGSVRLGSLFLTLPTRALTGQQIISSELRRCARALTRNTAIFGHDPEFWRTVPQAPTPIA